MILLWCISCFDTRDKEFKDRDLYLNTDNLDPVTKAAVEACYETSEHGRCRRDMLKYRKLFTADDTSSQLGHAMLRNCRRFGSVCIDDYYEDENGTPIPLNELGVLLTGNPNAVLIPPGYKQHDIAYMFAAKPPVDFAQISVTLEDVKLIAYFVRDLREMVNSTFYREGPGTLSGVADPPGATPTPMTVKTAASDEEIRSFVTIFRRLYMEKEPANFQEAVKVCVAALGTHPFAKWLSASAADVTAKLSSPPFAPFVGRGKITFSVKRLIDVFLYTQYAHQPDARRARQFDGCLSEVGGDRAKLTHLFFSEIWRIAIKMQNCGQYVARFLDAYQQHHACAADVITSPGETHEGIGSLETRREREERILREKAGDLAKAVWEQAGKPAGGSQPFFDSAYRSLKAALSNKADNEHRL